MLRHAVFDDCEDLLNWRNDPMTRTMSIIQDAVKKEDHDNWYRSSLNNLNRTIYIAEKDGQKIGMCRFDYNADENFAELSINLNPTMRGMGLSVKILKQAIEQYPNSCPVIATVKKDNVASARAFKKAGFKQYGNDLNYLYLKKVF